METLNASTIGKARRETLHGRDYYVAPMTILVPGILNGSQGPLFYPSDEVSKNVTNWNHKPLTLGHPPNGAGDPQTLNTVQLGFLLNTRVENGNLVSDGWFDIARLMQVDRRILENLSNGKPIELSTGLSVDQEPVENGNYNGKSYSAIARNYRPDHLAILPDAKGACSIADGCGVLVNELKNTISKLSPEEVRELVSALQGDKPMASEKLVKDLIANCDCWKGQEEILSNMTDEQVQKFLDKAKAAKQAEAVANAAKAGFENDDRKITFNEETGKWDVERVFKLSNDPPKDKPVEPTKDSILNAMKGLSAEEWFEMAPPEVQETTREATEIRNAERAKLIETIVDNSEDSLKESNKRIAENMKTDALKSWVSTLPKKVTNNPFAPSYAGAAAAVSNESIPKPEPIPDFDWTFTS